MGGGQKELKFHNVVMGPQKEGNPGVEKTKKRSRKKTDLVIKQYDPDKDMKKRKKQPDKVKEGDSGPLKNNTGSCNIYSEEENKVSPLTIAPYTWCSEASVEEESSLPLDLSMKKHSEDEDERHESTLVLSEPPPLEPIEGTKSHHSLQKQEYFEDVTERGKLNSFIHNGLNRSKELLFKDTKSFLQEQQNGEQHKIVVSHLIPVNNNGTKDSEAKFLHFELTFESRVSVSEKAPKIEPQETICKAKSSREAMIQTNQKAAGNVGVFRTFRNVKMFESHKKETRCQKKITPSFKPN